MAKICDSCGRGGMIVQWRSHSNVATRHKQQVNLQTKRVDGIRVRYCARCIKSAKTVKRNAAVAA